MKGLNMKTTEERSVSEGKKLNRAIRIDEAQIRSHLDTLVRDSVEDTLNKLLDSEADRLCNARRYEHSEERTDRRAGHYPRKLQTRVGEVQLKMPRLRQAALDTLIIERYRRKEASIEESLVEMYLAGLSVRTVEDMSEQLVGSRVSASTVSDLNQKIYQRIELWRNRPIEGKYPYVYLDGIYLKRSWGGEVRNVAILVAVGVNEAGFREILGICEGAKEDLESWKNFLCHLKQRGLKGVQVVISDKCLGLLEALGQVYPEVLWQRCMVHWYRNVFSMVPSGKVKAVAAMLKAIHAQEDKAAALAKAEDVIAKLKAMKLGQAAEKVREGVEETLRYMAFPSEHWRRIRTNNMLERAMREIRRRTNAVGCFPDGTSALMLSAARLRHVAGGKWGTQQYLNMKRLEEQKRQEESVPVGQAG
jgi:transposase-like protein